jgi:hydrogenase large subunit
MPANPKGAAYSWVKAPRYNNLPCEVGPLARMWMNGDYRNGISVMDRHRARAQEALKIAQAMQGWVNGLDTSGPVYAEPPHPANASGYALTEAPRGALGHWITITNRKTSQYEVISPTSWNCAPRDARGIPGPLEQALLGVPVQNADEPVEVLRVIHSFDPCLDCATHVLRPKAGAKIFAIPHVHGEPGHEHAHTH